MGNTKIDYASVKDSVEKLYNLNIRMRETVDAINSIATEMQSENIWLGIASDNYKQKLNDVCSNFDNMSREIDNTIAFMADCSEGYEKLETKIKEYFQDKYLVDKLDYRGSKYYGGIE